MFLFYVLGLIFTSPRCVESIWKCIQGSEETTSAWNRNLKVKWASKRVFCVGPSTAQRVLDLFNGDAPPNIFTSPVGTSEDLARLIIARESSING